MAKKKPIVSSLGQWAYPGEVTIIPSNQITMQGVNYPVLGIDNLGNQQVMIPGMDYIFPGDYVTEIPAAQFGGMSKRKIDNILNKNQDLNWVQRLYQSNTPRIQIPGEPGLSTHFMETGDGRVYPTVVQMPDGQLQYLGDNAYDYAMLTGEYIQFPNDRQARRFAKNYKKGTDVLEEFGKGGLTQWFAEKWVDVKTGKPCGRSGKDKDGRPYPACRPSKRVNETTPKTSSEMSPAEKAKFKREKTSGKRIDYNHKRRQDGGENWLDEYQTGGFMYTPPARTSFLKSNTPVGGYSDNTRVNNPNNNVSDQTRTRIEAQRAEEARRKRSGVISAGTTPSTYQKIKDATSFVENEKQRTGSASPLSYVLDVVNPATYAFAATDLVGNTGSAIKNVAQGNFQEAGSDLLNAGMNVLYLLPAVSPAKSAARFATTQTPLKNAYKINPWAFKPNPNAYYRMIGKEGYADALESGVIRPPQKTRIFDQGSQQYIDIPIPAYQEAYYNAQFPLDRRWYPNSIKKIDPKKAETAKKSGYAGPYMAEVTGNSNLFKNGESVAAYTGPNSSQTVTYSKEFIPINTPGVKFYKEDWLQGYKPIQISDMQPSASLSNLNKTDIRYLSRELLGEALSGNKNRQAIAEGNAWLKNWIDDPITQAKIDTDLGWIPERNNILKDQFSLGYEQAKSFTPLSKEYPFSEQFKDLFVRNQPHIHSGNSGVSYLHRRDPYSRSIGEMFSNPKLNSSWISRNLSMSKPMRKSTTIHEGTHDWTSDFLLRESGQLDDIKKLYPDKIKEINKNWQSLRDQGINPSTVMGTENANLGYLADPTEVHARVMELRQLLGMTPEQSVMVTPEKAADIIRIIQKPENAKFIDPKFLDVIESDPKKLASLFNRLWATAPIGIGAAGVVGSQLNKSESKPQMKMGGWLDSYQDGGESLPELNSKIDVANFYKTPLSNKYGIFQNPDTGNLEYYLKSNTEEPVSYTSEKGAPDLSDISGKKLKASQEELSNIEPTTSIILPREKEVYDEEDAVMNDLSDDIVITPPSEEELLKYLPKIEDSKEPTKVKEPVKVNTQQKQFTFNPTYWDNSDLQTEVFNRQLKDNKWYGSFNKRGDNVLNRTDVKRNYDSEVFLQDVATPNSVIIDIGSALGNNNPKLAGVSVYELTSNPKIKSKNIKVIATDIPSEIKGFEQLKKNSTVYPIDYATVPETFNTPVRDILKNKKIENVKDVYLRAANSIDLLMNVEQTAEHFKHISNTLKDKNVTYLYNNVILYKPAGSTKFEKMGNLNNSAFDHRSATWKNNPNRNHYTLLPTRSFGGENNWLNKYK
jgi:hypothetical protein